MFNKPGTDPSTPQPQLQPPRSPTPSVTAAPTPPAPAPAPALDAGLQIPPTPAASPRPAGRLSDQSASVLGPDLKIRGGIEGSGQINLQGRAWGDVKVEGLMVGENAELEGSVVANIVEVRGRVSGSIQAHSVRLLPSARVDGDITYEQLQIDAGAQFEGRCIRAVNAATAQAKPAAEKRETQPKPAPAETVVA